LKVEGFRNRDGQVNTIRVDCKVVHETDTGHARATSRPGCASNPWTRSARYLASDSQGRTLYPEGFEELSHKLSRPLHPPGATFAAIVSVGMLTEGWDCNTVTHIIGLRPFIVAAAVRAGRRPRSATGAAMTSGRTGFLSEEVAQVLVSGSR